MKSLGQIAYEACFASQKKDHDHFNYPEKWNEIAAAVERACGLKLRQILRAAKREKRQADKLLKGQMLNDSRIIGELKRETRDVWKTMSDFCGYRATWCKEALCKHYMVAGDTKCEMSNCPLLRRGKGNGKR